MKTSGFVLWLSGIAVALLILAGCATTDATGAGASGAPVFYVMRHLQKSTNGSDPALSAEGATNAVRAAAWFEGRAKPGAIYVSTTRRARETAAPLAAKLGLTPIEYDPRDTPGLVARVRAESGSVLVVGHSNTVPDIVAALGGARPEPLADSDYGSIWTVAGEGGATARFELQAKGK
ncbi:MAG TPA: phosphoglycerate mutase family protein [Allosphingosinicella sp.]|jgi:phosphohistidine phosphatase SixA